MGHEPRWLRRALEKQATIWLSLAELLKIRVVDLREARSQGHDVHSPRAALHLMCRLVQLAIPPGTEGSAAKRAMLKCLLELGFEPAPEGMPGPDIYVQRAVHMAKLGLPMKQLAAANRVVGESYAAYNSKMAPVLAEMPRWVEAKLVPGAKYMLLRVDRLLKLLPKLKQRHPRRRGLCRPKAAAPPAAAWQQAWRVRWARCLTTLRLARGRQPHLRRWFLVEQGRLRSPRLSW